MLFSSVLLLASFATVLAAPVPVRLSRRGDSTWPSSDSQSGEPFGISQSVQTKTSSIKTVDGQPALVASYPKGSYAGAPANPGIAGFIFQGDGGGSVDLSNAKEAELSYEVQFPSGFDFVLAGKLPGLYGGDNPSIAKTCAGGHHNDSCWSARLMWRQNGMGELYAYLPTANQALPICKGKCDVKYGASIGRGNWTFTPGEWTQITERVQLNSVNQMDGEIEIKVGGETKVYVPGLQLRNEAVGRISGAMVHTFFGGSSSTSYASTKDQEAYFRNFAINVTKTLD